MYALICEDREGITFLADSEDGQGYEKVSKLIYAKFFTDATHAANWIWEHKVVERVKFARINMGFDVL